ncbi:MAG: crotonase/enoyl-CoA hydratase family protein [Myxococcales bacterium]|nr:crotonase/enoyl-CoA hydratase family protein [Myxococcales bacterium]
MSIQIETRGDVTWLTIDDGKANALSTQLVADLGGALTELAGKTKALVIAGRPGRFCAGYDLKVMMAGKDAASALTAAGCRVMAQLYTFPAPVVVACTGHAMAGGALLLLCGDVRIGVEGPFKIGLNEVQIGMPLPQFGIDLVTDRLDPRMVTRATMCAHTFDPASAASAGFLDRCVAPDQLVAAVQAEAEQLAQLGTLPYARTKLGLRQHTADKMVAEVDANLAVLLG